MFKLYCKQLLVWNRLVYALSQFRNLLAMIIMIVSIKETITGYYTDH